MKTIAELEQDVQTTKSEYAAALTTSMAARERYEAAKLALSAALLEPRGLVFDEHLPVSELLVALMRERVWLERTIADWQAAGYCRVGLLNARGDGVTLYLGETQACSVFPLAIVERVKAEAKR